MWRIALLASFLLAAALPVWAQLPPVGPRSAALGQATTALAGELWSAGNPASRAAVQRTGIAFFGREGFLISELRTAALVAVHPTRRGVVAIEGATFGFESYRETQAAMGIATALRPGTTRPLFAGIDVRYHHVAISHYGSTSRVLISAGWIIPAGYSTTIGARVVNLTGARLGPHDPLPRGISLGGTYSAGRGALLLADVWKDVRFPLSYRAGIEATVIPHASLRLGIATAPACFTAGAGFRTQTISADLAAEFHETLGLSPSVAFSISL